MGCWLDRCKSAKARSTQVLQEKNFKLRHYHSLDTSRTVSFDGFNEQLTADYDASSFQAFAELGSRLDVTSEIFVHPFISVSHIALEVDGFTETAVGGGTNNAALTAEDVSQALTSATIGLGYGTEFADGGEATIKLNSMIGWRQSDGDIDPETELSFADGDPFTITGSPTNEGAIIAEFSAGAELGNGLVLSAIYRGELGEDSQAHSLNASLTGRF